jgi:hypothetical protein
MQTKTLAAMSTKTKVTYGLATAAVIIVAGFIVMKTSGDASNSNYAAGTAGYKAGYSAPGYVPPGYTAPGYSKPGYVPPGYTKPGYKK